MKSDSVERRIETAASSLQRLGARTGIRITGTRTLERWLYGLAALLGALWSLGMWGAYALLSLGDEALRSATRFFTIDAGILEWLVSFIAGSQQLGASVLVVLWALGVVLLAVGAGLARWLIRSYGRSTLSGGRHAI